MFFHSQQLPLETVHRISLYCIMIQTADVPSVDESFCEDMSSHIQICPVFSQLELMASELLVGWKIKQDSSGTPDRPLTILKTSIRSALLRRSSKLQSPNRISRSLYGKSWNHPCEAMLHFIDQYLVFLIARWPHWRTIFNMRTYQRFIQREQNLFRLVNNCSVYHSKDSSIGFVTCCSALDSIIVNIKLIKIIDFSGAL